MRFLNETVSSSQFMLTCGTKSERRWTWKCDILQMVSPTSYVPTLLYIHPSFLLLAEMDACYSYHHCLQPECPGFSLEIFKLFFFVCLCALKTWQGTAGDPFGPVRHGIVIGMGFVHQLRCTEPALAIQLAFRSQLSRCRGSCLCSRGWELWKDLQQNISIQILTETQSGIQQIE